MVKFPGNVSHSPLPPATHNMVKFRVVRGLSEVITLGSAQSQNLTSVVGKGTCGKWNTKCGFSQLLGMFPYAVARCFQKLVVSGATNHAEVVAGGSRGIE